MDGGKVLTDKLFGSFLILVGGYGYLKPLKQVIIWLSSGCLVSDFSLIKNSFTLV
jgi:hypothetical protein